MDKAVALHSEDVAAVAGGEIEAARQALVQKIGENISVRRIGVRTAESGVVGGYVHGNSRIAVLVELAGGTDELAKDVAMHVAAVNPAVVSPADMPEALSRSATKLTSMSSLVSILLKRLTVLPNTFLEHTTW